MSAYNSKKYTITLITVICALVAISCKTKDIDSVLTKEKFATDFIKNKKEYYHIMTKGDIKGAENYLHKVFALRHQLDVQCEMDSLVLIEYNEYLNDCIAENSDFLETEKKCVITKEYAVYIIDLSFRLQSQIQEQMGNGNQGVANRKRRELNYIGHEMERLVKLYPEFDKNSSVALFDRMMSSF